MGNVFPFKFFPQYFPILFTFAYTKMYSLVQFLEPLCAWNRLHQVLHTKQSYSLASNNSRKSNPFLFHFRTYYCKLFRILLVKANEISYNYDWVIEDGSRAKLKIIFLFRAIYFTKR